MRQGPAKSRGFADSRRRNRASKWKLGVMDEISFKSDCEFDRLSRAKSITRGDKKFPLVMMLEPLHACNLTCTGCGRIREYKSTINEMLTVEQCLAAVDDCGAPIVSICGGEPMIYPEIGRLVERDSRAQEAHLSLHERHVHPQASQRIHSRLPASSSTFIWTAWKRRTIFASSAMAFSAKPLKVSKRRKPQVFWSPPTPRSTKRRISRRLPNFSPTCRLWASMATCFHPLIPTPR